MEKMVVRRMVSSRPYLLHNGPEARAPRRPPRVYMEETTENWAVSMGIHWGSLEWRAALLMLFFSQVITS